MESRLVEQDGQLWIQAGQTQLPPMAYITYCPDAARYERFRQDGISLFSLGVYAGDQGINSQSGLRPFRPGFFRGKGVYDFSAVAEDLERIAPGGKGAFLIPRVYLDCPRWWEKEHPEELCCDVRGETLRQSFGSPVWRADMREALEALMDFVQHSPWRDAVIGYQVAAGGTEEWAYHRRFSQQLSDYSSGNIARYRDWLQERYEGIAALNRAYGTAYSSFEDIPPPTPIQRLRCQNGVLRQLPQEMAAVDYYAYHNGQIAETILYFCRTVKEYSSRTVLAGAFYGYVTEIMNTDVGHHALHTLLASPDIDFLASPNSYLGARSPANDWPFMAAVDSARFHHKLWFVETDTRTHDTRPLADSLPESCPDAPVYEGGVWRGPDTLESSLSLLKRNAGRVLTGHTGMWWFDMWGGWFDAPEIRQLLRRTQALLREQTAEGFAAEIAVVIDDEAFRYFGVDEPALYQLIYEQRRELGVLGAPVHWYLAQDIAHPDWNATAYKLVVFLNCVNPSPQIRQGVERLKCNGRTLVWVYLEDAFHRGSCTGFSYRYNAADAPMQGEVRGERFPPTPLSCPRFEDARQTDYVLAHFADSTEPCVVWRQEPDHASVYSLLPRLPASLLADIATLSGVHLYSRTQDIVYAGGRYVCIQALSAGYKRIHFPFPVRAVSDAFTEENLRMNGMFMDFPMEQYETKLLQFEF